MHPLFKNKSGILSYLAVWVFFGLMLGVVLIATARLRAIESAAMTVPVVFVLSIECLGPWYFLRSLPLGTTPPVKLAVTFLIAAICMAAVVMGAVHIAIAAFGGMFPDLERRMHPAFPVLAGMAMLIYLLAIALHYVLFAFESSRQAELLSREAELKALKAQVNPHFLFNSLNSISALTSVDPAKARAMCVRLSEFLRNSLRLGERTSIPFAEELALTRTYLDVEQVRFGKRLRIMQDFDEACTDCEVPPLLVQPLVENSIKHGIATLVEGGEITMHARRLRDSVFIVIENPFDPEGPETRRNGFGLASVRNRLQARYGSAARLDIQVDGSRYRVALTIPCDARSSNA
ncbi:MAG: histidine kinase [Acidobacteriaceae bacterium]|nr:histidine kinase [Acidobacteriaceae bacterium]